MDTSQTLSTNAPAPLASQIISTEIQIPSSLKYQDGTVSCPPKLLLSSTAPPALNPLHTHWLLIDQNLSIALLSTISASLLPYIVYLDTCHQIWSTLECRLFSTNRSRVIQLKNELHSLTMCNQSMTDYLSTVKRLMDNIGAAGGTVDPGEIILYILNGLPTNYKAFKTSIRTKLTPISLDDLYSLLCSEEVNLANDVVKELSLSDSTLPLILTICSTITPSILPYVLHHDSTAAIWNTIERRLQASNRSRVIQLKNELHNISMKQLTMTEYLTEIKTPVDKIATTRATIDQEDIILYTMNDLPPSYQAFKMAIRTMLHPISLDDMYSLLLSEEINIQTEASRHHISIHKYHSLLYTRQRKKRLTRIYAMKFPCTQSLVTTMSNLQ
ncbi:hypothetical protein M5K25_022899 [Dendrobium thyrsiflorum]|uniref:Retrovirus-related Pol polyprotein from transposon TNT 1-94 n=1 Tax=Dendrobium thyrsiflorum TaxID=117978 RepID=A0ABD0U7H7_DENTH